MRILIHWKPKKKISFRADRPVTSVLQPPCYGVCMLYFFNIANLSFLIFKMKAVRPVVETVEN